MRIQTLSIVVGTRACDAKCPFCISKMTGYEELPKSGSWNANNLAKATKLAKLGGTTTLLLTGKGEPTLYPDEITRYLTNVGREFPFVELQTNAVRIGQHLGDLGVTTEPSILLAQLSIWYGLGLNTIAISTVGVNRRHNAEVYHEEYPDLGLTVRHLHQMGFSVRLCVMMQKEYVDTPEKLQEVIDWCHEHQVEQLTVRGIRRPKVATDSSVDVYTEKRGLSDLELFAMYNHINEHGTLLMTLAHGTLVYDVHGQNVCMSDCLTVEPGNDDIRTLIYYTGGRLTYDWQHKGAVLLGGAP